MNLTDLVSPAMFNSDAPVQWDGGRSVGFAGIEKEQETAAIRAEMRRTVQFVSLRRTEQVSTCPEPFRILTGPSHPFAPEPLQCITFGLILNPNRLANVQMVRQTDDSEKIIF